MPQQENDGDGGDGGLNSDLSRDLTKRAAAKLADLQARKAEILRKMQRLRYLADNLAGRRRTPTQNETRPHESTVEVPRHLRRTLRRACRIALMEWEGGQGSSQIFERIKKRGSASFDEYRDPLVSLVNELDAMARDGEVFCSQAGQEKLWMLKRE